MWENYEEAEALRAKLLEQGYDDAHLVPIRYNNRYYGFYVIQLSDDIEQSNMSTELKWESQLALQNFVGVKRIKPILENPKLADINPRDENLTTEQKQMILEECKTNMLYFYSVVTGTPLEEVARKIIPYSNLCWFDVSHDESGVMDGLEPKDPGNTIVGGCITNGTLHDLPVWYSRPWTLTRNHRYYPEELLKSLEVPEILMQTEEFNPYISSHRIFIPHQFEIEMMTRAWQLGMTTREYRKKLVIDAIQTSYNHKYALHISWETLTKITPDMIHYPEDWTPVHAPWKTSDDSNYTENGHWKDVVSHHDDNGGYSGSRTKKKRASRYMTPNKRV